MVKEYYIPQNLNDALNILDIHNDNIIPYSGGTDLMIKANENINYLFINKLKELKNIEEDEKYIYIGAGCTFTQIYNNKKTPNILKEIIKQIAAPAIRNMGTIAGNIANGSPKADGVLALFVTDSKICLQSKNNKRIISIIDFYKGKKCLDIKNNELITKILIPKKFINNFYYEKVSSRKSLAISRVSFIGLMHIEKNKIIHCATAFGAVSDVIIRKKEIDNMLIGKTISEAKNIKKSYLNAFENIIVPISGRVSKEYRKNVCINLLKEFLKIYEI